MSAPHTALADASSPDADRAGPEALLPDWVVHFLTQLILFVLQHMHAMRPRRTRTLPSWWVRRPDLTPGSIQELAASIRGAWGNEIARMCRLRGIGPEHEDWAYLSRTILAFGGSLRGLDGRKRPQPWWETPEIVPGMIRADAAASPPAASPRSPQPIAEVPPPGPKAAPELRRHLSWAALCRTGLARAGPGPSTGPPAVQGDQTLSFLTNGAEARRTPPF